jgi:hypothetical protein
MVESVGGSEFLSLKGGLALDIADLIALGSLRGILLGSVVLVSCFLGASGSCV